MVRHAVDDDDATVRDQVLQHRLGLGCAGALAVVNLILMGLIAYMFATLSYSNAEQERWYRGGSLAFLGLGALLPMCWLVLIKRGYRGSIKAIVAWMFAALLAFMGYVLVSGGAI